MAGKINRINEGFVAGVGFSKTSGFAIGDMTDGLCKNPKLLDAFKDGRKDIIFNGKPESQSITIFPANEDAMTIVSAFYRGNDAADRRSHCFCHGMIVDNRTFSEEVLPVLDAERFTGQFLTSTQGALELEDRDALKFFPVREQVFDSGTEKKIEASGDDEQQERKEALRRLFTFALKTIAKEGNYIVSIGESNRLLFLSRVYELLPPPLRYRMESCSCGEYGSKMMNILLASDEPYLTQGCYKPLTLDQILDEDITEYKAEYPTLYRTVADDDERKAFYTWLEESSIAGGLGIKPGVQGIQKWLEQKALTFRKQLTGQDTCNGLSAKRELPQLYTEENQELIMVSIQGTSYMSKEDVYAYDYDTYNSLAEMNTFAEAERILPDMRLRDLVKEYIRKGTLDAYTELYNSIFMDGVGDRLRSIQRRRLRDNLVKRDKNVVGKFFQDDYEERYVKLIMLAYQMTPGEYAALQGSRPEDEILFGPYWYEEVRRFIRDKTCEGKKLLGILARQCNPFG